ncbi:DUF2092 domain-containing protein [Mesorhizobium sp. BAC0120]|uniref:DUF2092 domain-containing protein n=1 Tax=Mesorhizobium sp. BAC0120 TaxID=3090670 RepID=UPI00298C14D7|nr:DUF2092 domain-containing protein [Mesorhizobium sp. BAC0120]MDW6021088.1 DUF2092 domain-containing protein [Mesorhizobium sp. BAC0120]
MLALPAAAVGLGLTVASASAEGVDPEAARILRTMTDYLAGLKSFTAEFDVEDEIIDAAGQKLQFSASGKIALERPGKFHFERKGSFADVELTFDGATISVLGKKANMFAQLESPGPTIDEAVEELRTATGLDASGADLFAANSYSMLTEDTTEATHVGTGIVGGVECEHLAFRNPRVDWQIWIKKGDKPLPLKYIVTTKWMTGAPQHVLRLRDWDTAPQFDAKQFELKAPAGATRIQSISADAVGELLEEPQQ